MTATINKTLGAYQQAREFNAALTGRRTQDVQVHVIKQDGTTFMGRLRRGAFVLEGRGIAVVLVTGTPRAVPIATVIIIPESRK